jgi:hypothetical protein
LKFLNHVETENNNEYNQREWGDEQDRVAKKSGDYNAYNKSQYVGKEHRPEVSTARLLGNCSEKVKAVHCC